MASCFRESDLRRRLPPGVPMTMPLRRHCAAALKTLLVPLMLALAAVFASAPPASAQATDAPDTRPAFSLASSHVATTKERPNIDLMFLSLIHISEPTRLGMISYAVFCLKKKK